MSRLRILSLLILIGIATNGGSGLLYGQSYSVNPLYIYGEHADLAADYNNNLHIIWLRYGTMYYGRIVNNAVTGTQTVPGTTSLVAVQWSWPHIAKSPSGDTVHVLWVGGDHKKLFHSWRNSAGTWTTETVRTSTYNQFYWPVCSVDAAGNVHAIYGNSPGDGNCDVFYTIKNTSGSWSTSVEISGGDAHLNTTNPDFNEHDMFSDPNGGIHVKWSLINTRYLRYRYCASGGSLASSPTEYMVDNSATSVGPGDIYVENNGTVHLGFNGYDGNVNIDHSYKLAGGSWTAPTRARTAANTAHEIWPTIAAPRDGTNRVFTAWAEGTSLMKMAVKDGSSWTLYDLDTAAGMNDDWIRPAMTVTDSAVYGIWRTGSAYNHSWMLGVIPTSTLALAVPNGGENWVRTTTQWLTWSSTVLSGTVKLLLYQNLNLIGTIAQNLPVGDNAYLWTVGNLATGSAQAGSNYKIRIQTTDNALYDDSDGTFNILSEIESITAPSILSGPGFGNTEVSYTYSTGGAVSSHGHAMEYKFDWDDGTDSGWLGEGITDAAHTWTANGTYHVRTMARCLVHTTVESPWSTSLAVMIAVPGTYFNSPANLKIIPEVIWAPATGGGTWISEVQITDISGDSQVSVYYSTAAGRRGPFLLWNNSSGGALNSVKYTNILQTIDGLDSGAFTYSGTVGALEVFTQDAAHVLQVMARTLNGNYSKTFSGLSLHDSNTADTSRALNIPNLTNNSAYRSTCGMYNPTADAVTVELRLLDSVNTQIGNTITKTLSGYGFSSFSPFNEAGRPYSAYSYDNVILRVQPTSGAGKVLSFGASANNVTNDPAAHLAVQNGYGHDNGPSSLQILPEAIWAPATGGGIWISEVQIVDVTGGSTVSVYFDYGGGNRRGPFALWTGSGAGSKVKYANILQQLGTLDSGFTYYGRVGMLEFQTQGGAYNIQVTARTLNGNHSKTFPGLNLVEAETADTSRAMIIQNYANNSIYRSTCGFYNPTGATLTVEFTLLNGNGAQIGARFSKTFVGYDFQAFSPFNEAGVPYPANSFDNVILTVRSISGSGQVVCFGASANNASNDPASHLAVQGQ